MKGRDQLIAELRSVIGRLEAVLSSIDEAILWTDEKGKAKWCNDSFASLIGLKRIFIMGKDVTDLFPLCQRGQELPTEAHPLSVALRNRISQQGNYTFGSEKTPFVVKVQYLETVDGPPTTIIIARDSSQEKELSEYRIQGAALAAAADAIVILDNLGRVHWTNKAFSSMTGYSFDEVYGKTLKILKSGKQSPAFYQELWSTILSGKSWAGELINRRKNGEIYYEEQSITPVLDVQGRVSNFIAIKSDITEKKLAQKSLEDREAKLSALFNGVIDAIVTADSKGRILSVNPAAEKIFGYNSGELNGLNVRVLVPPELRPNHDSFIRKYLKTGVAKVIGIGREIEAVRKDGSRFPIDLSINEIRTQDAVMFTAIVRDISERKEQERRLHMLNEQLEQLVDERTADLTRKTEELTTEVAERKKAEAEIRQSRELLRSLLDGISAAFLIIDIEQRTIAETNEIAETMFGFLRHEILGGNCDDIFSSQGEHLDEVCPRSYEGDATIETVIVGPDGSPIPVTRHVLPITIKSRPHLAVILFDISERKALESKLEMARKLESIGRLASGIAHEINTPIQYVGNSVLFQKEAFVDFLKIHELDSRILEECRKAALFPELLGARDEAAEDDDLDYLIEEIPESCDRAQEGVSRVADIVQAMKNFAHPGQDAKKPADINQLIKTTATVCRNEWKYYAQMDFQLQDIPLVSCFQGSINQVLLNMIVNAAHAIRDKYEGTGKTGKITISTYVTEDMVNISITDDGTGIPEEIRDKVFEPFYTTKKVGEGSGQGLAIVHDIVTVKHGGTIDIESTPGMGTTFLINLPLAQ
ncbi:PAS domain S-box protein [Desulfovibrio sp. JC010]|uniref:PAS domain S-box protein n=1 Tax=Desulfovibrio sp. JC010 TaxID=2593641 RepID=UPI0013D06500|nr:PAS domain S-box protein [Desulfovibrio sp. JC010]NDV27685.1 PAS domain S-box protein [Desulfovibrio sp. JC010]